MSLEWNSAPIGATRFLASTPEAPNQCQLTTDVNLSCEEPTERYKQRIQRWALFQRPDAALISRQPQRKIDLMASHLGDGLADTLAQRDA